MPIMQPNFQYPNNTKLTIMRNSQKCLCNKYKKSKYLKFFKIACELNIWINLKVTLERKVTSA